MEPIGTDRNQSEPIGTNQNHSDHSDAIITCHMQSDAITWPLAHTKLWPLYMMLNLARTFE